MALRRQWIIGPWRVDGDADEIEADGRVLKLEPLQMRLLLMLAEQAPQVVTTQALLDEVWRDLVVTPNSVYQAVTQLRRQLGDTAAEPAFIQTVHRKGYRLVAPVQRVEASPPPAEAVPAPATIPEGTATAAPATPLATAAPRRRLLTAATAGTLTLVAGAGGLAWWRSRPPPLPPGRLRLAVLAFDDRAGAGRETADRALARGLALDLTRTLGRRSDLDVLSSDAVRDQPAGTDAERSALARRLGVALLLDGELQRTGGQLRLDIHLWSLGGVAPVTLWQQGFERPPAAAAQLPGLIAAELAATLGLPTLPGAALPPAATEAYELHVLGESALRSSSDVDRFERARGYFQRGIALDPAFAPNYSGLAWSWVLQARSGQGGGIVDFDQAYARAGPLFDHALTLTPDAADALAGRAALQAYAGELDAARQSLTRALAAEPSHVEAHFQFGLVEFYDGWPLKSAAHFERVVTLNPLATAPVERLALARLFAGEADVAAQGYRRSIALGPRLPNGMWGLGIHGFAVGNLVQAVDGHRQALALSPQRPYLWRDLAWIYLDLQRPDDALTAFARAQDLIAGADWLAVHAGFAWAQGGPERGPPPAALALGTAQADQGSLFADLCLVRAMAGLPLDATLLARSVAVADTRRHWGKPSTWFFFQGWLQRLNLASVQTLLGQADAAVPAEVESQLDALERQGNRWPMLHFQRARVLALRQRPAEALAALERAMDQGCRRSWWLRLDPAFAALRGDARLQRLLAQVDDRLAEQRRQLGL